MKVFLVLSLIAIYNVYSSSQSSDAYIFLAKCPDDKTKTKQCAFTNTDTKTSKTEFLIFNKCGNGKTCDYSSSHMCIGDQKRKKIGGACNYDNDCAEGYCVSNKCTVLSEGQVCISSTSGFVGDCGTGLDCHSTTSGDYKCVKKIYTVGTEPKDTICGFGLATDKDVKCQRYGTLDDGAETNSALLCKSGLTHTTNDFKTICDSITTDATCKIETCDVPGTNCPPDGDLTKCINIHTTSGSSGSPGTPYLSDPSDKCLYITKTDAKWSKEGPDSTRCSHVQLYGSEYKAYPSKVKVQSVFYEDFLKDFDKLDLEKINTEDKYFNEEGSLKWKTHKNLILYENAPVLKAAGLIDDEGKVTDDKDCEYNFIIKHLSAGYTTVGLLVFALISLLF